jgi:hypothetical protein
MPDFSNSFFSYKGEIPNKLPERLRLENKFTRYANDILLEELESLGYLGPIELPVYGDNQHLEWNPSTVAYVVASGICLESKPCAQESAEARCILIDRITEAYSTVETEYVYPDEFNLGYNVYKGKLLDLYAKKDLDNLRCCDIPPLPMVPRETLEAQKVRLGALASGVIDTYKEQYEKYGIIYNVDPALVNYLPLPYTDWVRGSGMLTNPSFDGFIPFGRNVFS